MRLLLAEDEKELSFIEKVKNIFVMKNEDAEAFKEIPAKEEKDDLSENVQSQEEQEKEDEE